MLTHADTCWHCSNKYPLWVPGCEFAPPTCVTPIETMLPRLVKKIDPAPRLSLLALWQVSRRSILRGSPETQRARLRDFVRSRVQFQISELATKVGPSQLGSASWKLQRQIPGELVLTCLDFPSLRCHAAKPTNKEWGEADYHTPPAAQLY